MSETTFALLDADGTVLNVIVADQEFIDGLAAQVADPDVDTGDLTFDKAVDVTGKGVGPGHKRAKNGKFSPPVIPPPTPEEIAAQEAVEAADAQRAEDDAFLDTLDGKVRKGTSLTQDERDRKDVILARRS